jgi:hypothetical protein
MSEVNNVLNKLQKKIDIYKSKDKSLHYTYNVIAKKLIKAADLVIVAYLIDLVTSKFDDVKITYKSVNGLNFTIKLDVNFVRLYSISIKNSKIDLFMSKTYSKDFDNLFKLNLVDKLDYSMTTNLQIYGYILFKNDKKFIETIENDVKSSKAILKNLKVDL